jgi:hypothetical protein
MGAVGSSYTPSVHGRGWEVERLIAADSASLADRDSAARRQAIGTRAGAELASAERGAVKDRVLVLVERAV